MMCLVVELSGRVLEKKVRKPRKGDNARADEFEKFRPGGRKK